MYNCRLKIRHQALPAFLMRYRQQWSRMHVRKLQFSSSDSVELEKTENKFKSLASQPYLQDFTRLAQMRGCTLTEILEFYGIKNEQELLARSLEDSFCIEELRIKDQGGQPALPTFEIARKWANQKINQFWYPDFINHLNTEEEWLAYREKMIQHYVELPCQELVRKLLNEGRFPFFSNAYDIGPKGVLFLSDPFSNGSVAIARLIETPSRSLTE